MSAHPDRRRGAAYRRAHAACISVTIESLRIGPRQLIPAVDATARRSEAGVNEHRRWRMLPTLAVAGFLLLQSAAALAGGVIVTIIDGRKVKADITLPDPDG